MSWVDTEQISVDASLIADLVGIGGYTHPLFAEAADGADVPLPGQAVMLLAGGMVERHGVLDAAIAMLEMRSVRFTAMVHAGDALFVRVTPGPAHRTSDGRHVQEFEWRIRSGDTVVATAEIIMLMREPVEVPALTSSKED